MGRRRPWPPRCAAGPPWSVRGELGGRDGEEITVDIGMSDRLAREIASYGADAVVLEPQALRDEVLDRLRAHAGVGA